MDRGDCLVMKLGVVTCSIIRISVHQCLYVRKAVVIFWPCGVFGQFSVAYSRTSSVAPIDLRSSPSPVLLMCRWRRNAEQAASYLLQEQQPDPKGVVPTAVPLSRFDRAQ